jgi:hypothetical protein
LTNDRLRVGATALKMCFECSWATAHCASKHIFALYRSSSLDLDLRCLADFQDQKHRGLSLDAFDR